MSIYQKMSSEQLLEDEHFKRSVGIPKRAFFVTWRA